MDQKTGTTPIDAPPQGPDDSQPAEGAPVDQTGFGSRGRVRRRARFLRKARELAYRDLGGLVFNLHQFGQRNDALVLGKLATLSRIDSELRTIEAALQDRRPITVLREAGITACPRCAAIHGSEDRFCPNCGLPMARNVDLPVAGAPAGAPATVPTSSAPATAPAPASGPPAPAPTPAAGGQTAPGTTPAAPVPLTPPAAPSSPPAQSPSVAGPGPAFPLAASEPAESVQHSTRQPEESTEILHPQAPGS